MDINILTVFILAIFVGVEIITKVPPTLHTPLMSGSNAFDPLISGVCKVGGTFVIISTPTKIAKINTVRMFMSIFISLYLMIL